MLRVGWGLSSCVICTVEKQTLVRDHWVLDMYWIPFIIKNVDLYKNFCWGDGVYLLSVCIYSIVRKWLWGRISETVCRRPRPWGLKFSPCKICCYTFCTSSDIYFSKIHFLFFVFSLFSHSRFWRVTELKSNTLKALECIWCFDTPQRLVIWWKTWGRDLG